MRGFHHHLHSGEELGPAGTALAMPSGAALNLFVLSGLWMNVQLFCASPTKQTNPSRRLF